MTTPPDYFRPDLEEYASEDLLVDLLAPSLLLVYTERQESILTERRKRPTG